MGTAERESHGCTDSQHARPSLRLFLFVRMTSPAKRTSDMILRHEVSYYLLSFFRHNIRLVCTCLDPHRRALARPHSEHQHQGTLHRYESGACRWDLGTQYWVNKKLLHADARMRHKRSIRLAPTLSFSFPPFLHLMQIIPVLRTLG